jgi:hypothetical protein
MSVKIAKTGLTAFLIFSSASFVQAQQAGLAAKMPTPASGVSASGPAAALPASIDPVAIRRQMTAFQGILMRELQQSFEQPFGLLQDVKGMYLSRYGVAFHMEVNLVPLRLISMFDYRPYTEEELRATRTAKLARIQQLKTKLGDLLLANAQELAAMPPEQQIAVVVHLFNMPSERVEGLPSQVVVEVSRKTLLEAKAGLISKEELRKQISFNEL